MRRLLVVVFREGQGRWEVLVEEDMMLVADTMEEEMLGCRVDLECRREEGGWGCLVILGCDRGEGEGWVYTDKLGEA